MRRDTLPLSKQSERVAEVVLHRRSIERRAIARRLREGPTRCAPGQRPGRFIPKTGRSRKVSAWRWAAAVRRNRPFVGRGEPTGPADSGHMAALPDQQPVVAVLIRVCSAREVVPDEVRK